MVIMGIHVYLKYGNGPFDDVDISAYVMDGGLSPLNMRVESSREGEPGMVAFDTISMELPLSPVSYHFTAAMIQSKQVAGVYYKIFIGYNFTGTTRWFFTGLVDFDTVVWTQAGTVKFDVIDQLEAIKWIEKYDIRTKSEYDPGSDHIEIEMDPVDANIVYFTRLHLDGINWVHLDWDTGDFDFASGEVWMYDDLPYLVLSTSVVEFSGPGWTADVLKVTLHNEFPGVYSSSLSEGTMREIEYYGNDLFSEDCSVYDTGVIVGYDAEKIRDAILAEAWPSATIYESLTGPFYIHLDHFATTGVGNYEDMIMGNHPAEALKQILSAMLAYLTIDTDGDYHIVPKPSGSPSADLTLTTAASSIPSWEKRYSWNKKVGMVHVWCTGLDGTQEDADYPAVYSEESPDTLEIEVYKPNDLTLAEVAEDLWEFYGKRHLGANITIPLTDAVAQVLSVLMVVSLDSVLYFTPIVEVDFDQMTVRLELASYETWGLTA